MKTLIQKNTILYVVSNAMGKALAAFAQFFAVYVFTKTQTQEDAALFFLLLGYAIWFQFLELGLSQALQNKFNSRKITSAYLMGVVLMHYAFMILIAILISCTSFLGDMLLSSETIKSNPDGFRAFSIGAAILVVTSSNTLLQRVLLVINKGLMSNLLLAIQSCIVILGLVLYQKVNQANLLIGIFLYLGPQILVYMPTLFNFYRKLKKKSSVSIRKCVNIFIQSLEFSGITLITVIFLGVDYYFAAHYLDSEEVISYYLVSRIFFVSYALYYGYVIHRARRLVAAHPLEVESESIMIFRESSTIGVLSVVIIYVLSFTLNQFGVFTLITHGIDMNQFLLFISFLYFIIRVFRDVSMVIIGALNKKFLLFRSYLIELVVGFAAMYLLVPKYKAIGIFYALLIACVFSFIYLFFNTRGFLYIGRGEKIARN